MDDLPKRDPGWGAVWRHIGLALLIPLPQFALWRMARKGVDALTGMRAVFISWLETPLLIILVVWIIMRDSTGDGSINESLFVAGIVVFGVLGLSLVRYFDSKPLDASDNDKLVTAYTSSFFVRMALAQAVFLMGFVGAFITDNWWMVLVGLPFTLIGFAQAAPTSSNLTRAQERLRSQGSTVDLTQVLLSRPFKLGSGSKVQG